MEIERNGDRERWRYREMEVQRDGVIREQETYSCKDK